MAPDTCGSRRAFVAVTYAVVVMLAGSNLPTPLYPAYQRLFDLSPLMVTLVFATYAVAVMPCLFVAGPLSDAVGRRAVLLPAVGLGIVAAGVFAFASNVVWLFVAQVVEGVAMGGLQGAAVAALIETHPRGRRDRAALTGSTATVAGAALGPLLAGLLARFGPLPRRLPFLIEAVLLTVALVVIWTTYPVREGRRGRWQARRPSAPPAIRRLFPLSGAAAFFGWAVTALFLSLIPAYVVAILHTSNVALIGALAALVLACSAVVQLALPRVDHLTAQATGLGLTGLAAGLLVVAAHVHTLAVFVSAAVLAGLGLGMAFHGSLGAVSAEVPEDKKGDILSALYLLVYLGTAVPVIGVGLEALATGLRTAVETFGYAIGAVCVVLCMLIASEVRRGRKSNLR